MSTPRHLLEVAGVAAIEAVARTLPRSALLRLGENVGALAGKLDARHRAVALENLGAALGTQTAEAERRAIAARCWRHFGRIAFDTLAFHRFSRASVGRDVRVEGVENLERAYAGGRGVLEFTAHFGHWELAGLIQGFLGFPLAVVARPLDNPLLERRLARLRGLSGNAIVHKRHAVREMLRALGRGMGVAIVIDQDARESGVFVPFFGRPASTTPTLAVLAVKTRVPVLPVFCVAHADHTYTVHFGAPLSVRTDADRNEEVLRFTARCTQIVEEWVRRHPEQWLWMHRRWKTPQEG